MFASAFFIVAVHTGRFKTCFFLGCSQPISIPSSAKPRDSIQLSSSHDPLISTSHSKLDSMDTLDFLKPLEGLSSILGKDDTTGT